MRGRKSALRVVLTDQERNQLLQWSRSTALPAGLVTRAEAVLLVAAGSPLKHVGKAVGLTEAHVRQWIRRFLERRLHGLHDLPGRGRKPSFSPCGGGICGQDRL